MNNTYYGMLMNYLADDLFRVRKGKQLPYTKNRTEVKQDAIRRERQGRNEKCNCGSKKKFKKCCGKVINEEEGK